MAAGDILKKLDVEADPCQDFYQFTCGKYLRDTEIPPTESKWGTFYIVQDKVTNKLHYILKEEVQAEDPVSVKNMKVMYKACNDMKAIEDAGYTKFLADVVKNKYGGFPMILGDDFDASKFKASEVLGMLRGDYGSGVVMSAMVDNDRHDSSVNVIYIDQPSLVLPRQMYVDPANFKTFLDGYKAFVTGLAKVLIREAKTTVTDAELEKSYLEMLKLETFLAEISTPAEDRRNETDMYNPFTLGQLKSAYPKLNFDSYFKAVFSGTGVNLKDDQVVIVIEPSYFEALNSAMAESKFSVKAWADYVFWRMALSYSSLGPKEVEDLNFNFEAVLQGTAVRPPRWKECTSIAAGDFGGFGFAAGFEYIKKNFDQESKEVADDMVMRIRKAFKSLVSQSKWMDAETQVLAQEKADAMLEQIGYPEWLPDKVKLDEYYAGTQTQVETKHMENVLGQIKWVSKRDLKELSNPPDRKKWFMSPPTVNAWYAPNFNSITFPAGILQPPFFSKGFPRYLDYGAIGVVIGHEITHGFDDQGRQFDKIGTTSPWWSDNTVEAFEHEAQCFIDQYGNYSVPELGDEANLNGVNTQGENIADNGGIREAYQAYLSYIQEKNGGNPEHKLPGLMKYTNEQLFFISHGQVWCELMTTEALQDQVLTNPHSPGKYRVWGPVSNSDDFRKAFNCDKDAPMNPTDKCILW